MPFSPFGILPKGQTGDGSVGVMISCFTSPRCFCALAVAEAGGRQVNGAPDLRAGLACEGVTGRASVPLGREGRRYNSFSVFVSEELQK